MQYVFQLGNIFTNTFIFEDVYFFFSLMLTSVNMYVLSIRNLTVALTWAIRRVVLCAFLVSLVMGFESNHLPLMVQLNEYETDPVNT